MQRVAQSIAAATRARVLAAALKVVEVKDFHSRTIEDDAALDGASSGAIYVRLGLKEQPTSSWFSSAGGRAPEHLAARYERIVLRLVGCSVDGFSPQRRVTVAP
ncbi:hypothetical protein D9V41_09365 [Aeromicrobium phragmitis]|uniref:Uncharacterized protein n=1 Tax=Aeromicrobium phragmitis TaxID=2478914 RepID=A0A3L8PMA4_9ACTN|nr:hypothetical protein [Aeromicrobium phragmitis]RLV55668.1 hypothetical protein D9V41_09365 [Aeromicrobium phragmitis]